MNKHILNYWIQSLSDSIKMGIRTTETSHVKAEINEYYDGCLHEKHLNNVINHFTGKKTTKERQEEKKNEMKVITHQSFSNLNIITIMKKNLSIPSLYQRS